jgi:hypothetical protein
MSIGFAFKGRMSRFVRYFRQVPPRYMSVTFDPTFWLVGLFWGNGIFTVALPMINMKLEYWRYQI